MNTCFVIMSQSSFTINSLGKKCLHSLANNVKYFSQAVIPSSLFMFGYIAMASDVEAQMLGWEKFTCLSRLHTSRDFVHVTWSIFFR